MSEKSKSRIPGVQEVLPPDAVDDITKRRTRAVRKYFRQIKAKKNYELWAEAEEARMMIPAGELIAGLVLHWQGKLELTDSQINVGLRLLNKRVPDLQSSKVEVESGGKPIQIQLIPLD